MVSCICYSGQGDLFAIVVIILAIYPTLIESIDSRNKVSVVEVGYIFSVFCSCEGDGRLCGYLNSVLSPFYEVKACGWSRRQRHFIAVPVGAIAADCATVGRVGRGGDGVLVDRPLSVDRQVFRRHRGGQLRIPAGKGVASLGRVVDGRDGCAEGVGLRAQNVVAVHVGDGETVRCGQTYFHIVKEEVTAFYRGGFNGKVVVIAIVAAKIYGILCVVSSQRDVISDLHESRGIIRVIHDTHMQCANKVLAAVCYLFCLRIK